VRHDRLRADWEHLGETDAHWAVLSDPGKRRGGWDLEEFYAGSIGDQRESWLYAVARRPLPAEVTTVPVRWRTP
jgi:hypothetical protein